MRSTSQENKTFLIVCYLWSQAFLGTLHGIIFDACIFYEGKLGTTCSFKWDTMRKSERFAYVLVNTVINYILPAVFIVFTNLKVFGVARTQHRKIRSSTFETIDIDPETLPDSCPKTGRRRTETMSSMLSNSNRGNSTEITSGESLFVMRNSKLRVRSETFPGASLEPEVTSVRSKKSFKKYSLSSHFERNLPVVRASFAKDIDYIGFNSSVAESIESSEWKVSVHTGTESLTVITVQNNEPGSTVVDTEAALTLSDTENDKSLLDLDIGKLGTNCVKHGISTADNCRSPNDTFGRDALDAARSTELRSSITFSIDASDTVISSEATDVMSEGNKLRSRKRKGGNHHTNQDALLNQDINNNWPISIKWLKVKKRKDSHVSSIGSIEGSFAGNSQLDHSTTN